MKKFLFLFAVGILFSYTTTSCNAAPKIKVACIGDSITYGHGIEKRNINSYPAKLQELLGKKYKVKNFGVSGSTMTKGLKLSYSSHKKFKRAKAWSPNIIIIMLGTNDACQGNGNWKGKKTFKKDYISTLTILKNLKSKPTIYICSPVPPYLGDCGRREVVMEPIVIPTILEIVKEENVKYIDLYKALSNNAKVFPDKIHPNAEGAKLIAQSVYENIEKKIEK